MRDDESSGSDYASESEEEIDEREFTCENVRVRARARVKGVKTRAEGARGNARGRGVKGILQPGAAHRGAQKAVREAHRRGV